MGKPKDQSALQRYREFLLTRGQISGYIQWKRVPLEWLSSELPNLTAKLFHELMCRHVAAGGIINQVEEKRPEYVVWRFHYDLRMPLSQRRIYVETIFEEAADLDDCTIRVVSLHDA